MSGLLHQLGMQALGRPAALRPAERLRSLPAERKNFYTDTDGGFSESETVVAPSLPDRARDVPIANRVENEQPFAATRIRANEREAAPALRADAAAPIVDASVIGEESPQSTPSIARDESVVRVEKIDSVVDEPAPRSTVETRATNNGRRAARERESKSENRFSSPRPRAESSVARRTPDRNVRHRVEGERAQSALPDVHIHIGRIELTAVTAPAPARRERPAATKPAMSLDEYLQLRNRKSS